MDLNRKLCVFGVKQTLRAIKNGYAQCVYIADDASRMVVSCVEAAARDGGLELVTVPTMKELGRACGIAVDCSCAARISEDAHSLRTNPAQKSS